MASIYVYYRISDTPAWGPERKKLPYVNNENCLKNFIENFRPNNLYIVADAIGDATRALLDSLRKKIDFFVENVNNKSGSATFMHVFDLALKHGDEDIIYFVEDDFLHLPGTQAILLEAFNETDADYVTLFDHLDKYVNRKDGGPNPFVKHGGEPTRVIVTRSTHWKMTNSTVLTFAARVKTLREDEKEWRKCARSKVPSDYMTFIKLTKALFFFRPFKKKRTLIHPIPARATHGGTAYLSPFIDWGAVARLES